MSSEIEQLQSTIRALKAEIAELKRFARLSHDLSLYAAASRDRNTPEFLSGLFDECSAVQSSFKNMKKIMDAPE